MKMKNKYLIALPCFPCKENFNHQTILVSAKDKADAINLVFHLRPQTRYIGKIKQVHHLTVPIREIEASA